MATKKKAVKKVEKVDPPYYATLTEEQFDAIERFSWNNPLDELKSIVDDGDTSMIELGFKLGTIHRKFKEMIDDIGSITEQIKPNQDNEDDEEDNDY